MFELDEFLHNLERVRERTRRVAACIPADRVEWTYKAGAFTLGDLVRHIAVTERFIWAETVHNRPVAYVSHGRELADGRDAVLAFFDRLHEESLAQFRALTPAMLGEKCVTPAGTRADDVEVAADDAGARNPPPRPAVHDARDAERPDAAALRNDGFAGKAGRSEVRK